MGGIPSLSLNDKSGKSFIHPIQLPFLVGKRPRGELLLLGGRWDPRDGGHPADDPSSLIQTVIRTVKESYGTDLSACMEWTRLLEIQYRRSEGKAEGSCAAHVEHTVVFVALAASVASANVSGLAELAAAQVCSNLHLFAQPVLLRMACSIDESPRLHVEWLLCAYDAHNSC